MEFVTYSHRYSETILTHEDQIKKEIQEIVNNLTFSSLLERYEADNKTLSDDRKKSKISMLFSLKSILKDAFGSLGWTPNAIIVEDSVGSLALDYCKEKIGVTISFNNRVCVGNDLLCFQAAGELRNTINLGIYVCCTKGFSKKLLTPEMGMVCFEKVVWYLEKFKSIITVPIWVIGLSG